MPASTIGQSILSGLAFADQRQQQEDIRKQQELARQQQFLQLDDQRKGALFKDARTVNSFIKANQPEQALNVLSNRMNVLEQIGGDTSDTREIADFIVRGDMQGAVNLLDSVELAGVQSGFLQDLTTKNTKPKLGTYNPSDYTVSSWSEFAKNGDPSILERYQSDNKDRQAELREKAQELKEEKFQLTKQKEEIDLNRKKITKAEKQKDAARVKYLETKDAQNSLSNINSLLENDLDLIYGGAEWVLPDKFRSQKGKNMLARKNQVVSSLKLMAAGKLKGQGSITENERTMLAQAATTLENQDIDPSLAEEELKRIIPIYNYFISGESTVSDEDLLRKYGGL